MKKLITLLSLILFSLISVAQVSGTGIFIPDNSGPNLRLRENYKNWDFNGRHLANAKVSYYSSAPTYPGSGANELPSIFFNVTDGCYYTLNGDQETYSLNYGAGCFPLRDSIDILTNAAWDLQANGLPVSTGTWHSYVLATGDTFPQLGADSVLCPGDIIQSLTVGADEITEYKIIHGTNNCRPDEVGSGSGGGANCLNTLVHTEIVNVVGQTDLTINNPFPAGFDVELVQVTTPEGTAGTFENGVLYWNLDTTTGNVTLNSDISLANVRVFIFAYNDSCIAANGGSNDCNLCEEDLLLSENRNINLEGFEWSIDAASIDFRAQSIELTAQDIEIANGALPYIERDTILAYNTNTGKVSKMALNPTFRADASGVTYPVNSSQQEYADMNVFGGTFDIGNVTITAANPYEFAEKLSVFFYDANYKKINIKYDAVTDEFYYDRAAVQDMFIAFDSFSFQLDFD